jgi:hypothetical protein
VIERTRAVFEPFYRRALSDDDVIALLLNTANLFRMLRDSSKAQITTKAASERDDEQPRRARRQPATRKHNGDPTCNTKDHKVCP